MNTKVKDLVDGQSLTFYGLVTNLVKGVTANGATIHRIIYTQKLASPIKKHTTKSILSNVASIPK